MKFIASCIIALCLGMAAFAGENTVSCNPNTMQARIELSENDSQFVISGNITDCLNNETLAGAVIHADGKKVYSDLDGHFSIPVEKPGTYTLTVELISYETAQVEVEVKENATGIFSTELAQK